MSIAHAMLLGSKGRVKVAYLGTQTSSTDLTTYNFTSQAIGTAINVICVFGRQTTGITVSTVTVDGVSATQRVSAINSGSGSDIAEIWTAPASNNATGTVSVTFSGAVQRCAIAVYSINGARSAAPAASATDTTLTGQDLSAGVAVITNGVTIGAVLDSSAGTGSCVWTNLTENVDAALETVATSYSAASIEHGLGGGLTVTATLDAGVARGALAIATWAP